MPLDQGKHIIKEIEGIRCSLVEEHVSAGRMEFLKKLLSHNGFEVKVMSEGEEEEAFTVGVTDMLFNPVVYVYELRMKTPEGRVVNTAYWLQISDKGMEPGEIDEYWTLSRAPDLPMKR